MPGTEMLDNLDFDYLQRRGAAQEVPSPELVQIYRESGPKPVKMEEPPFEARHPNLYGLYGAGKAVVKSFLPYLKYIDPEERQHFMKLSTEEQTRDLLWEALNAAVLGRWKPLAKFGSEVTGAALQTFLPKTHAMLTKPLFKATTPVAPVAQETRTPSGTGVVSPGGEIVQPGVISGEAPASETWAKVKDLADNWENTVELQRRGYRPREQARQEGQDLGLTLEKAQEIAPGTALNDSQAAALVDLVHGVAVETQQAAVKALESKAPEDMNLFLSRFLSLGEVDPVRWGARSEAGRSLGILNEPLSGMNQYIDQFSKALGMSKDGISPERLAAMVSTLKTPGEMARMAREAVKPGPVSMIMETWINGLLSGPVTHAANISGNTLATIMQIPERFVAAGWSKVLPGESETVFAEAMGQLYGLIGGLKDGLRLAGQTLRYGESAFGKKFGLADIDKIEIRKAITGENMNLEEGGFAARTVDFLGEMIRLPGRGLLGEDDFFKGVAYRMELHAQAYRQATREGLTGEPLQSRINEILANPPAGLKAESVDFAKYITYTKDLGETGQAFLEFVNSHPVLRFIFPFVRTPANIFKFAGERTPLALFSKAVRADLAEGGPTRDLALARMSVGTALMAITAAYVAEGRITGAGPSDKQMNAALQRTGWQPFSIRIGDAYYSYGRLEPFSTILGTAASGMELYSAMDEGEVDAEKIPSVLVAAISKNVTNKTFLRGVINLIEAMEDPDRYGKRYVQNLVGSAVPTMSAQITRTTDPTWVEVNSIMDAIKARVPGYSKDLPPRRDLWGNPRGINTWGPRLFSPIPMSEKRESLADEEILRLRVPVAMPSRKIDGVELTPQEYDRYVLLAGGEAKAPYTNMGLKETLEDMMKGWAYQAQSDGPDGGKALMIKSMVHVFREVAQHQLMKEFPELADAVMAEQLSREEKKKPPR